MIDLFHHVNLSSYNSADCRSTIEIIRPLLPSALWARPAKKAMAHLRYIVAASLDRTSLVTVYGFNSTVFWRTVTQPRIPMLDLEIAKNLLRAGVSFPSQNTQPLNSPCAERANNDVSIPEFLPLIAPLSQKERLVCRRDRGGKKTTKLKYVLRTKRWKSTWEAIRGQTFDEKKRVKKPSRRIRGTRVKRHKKMQEEAEKRRKKREARKGAKREKS